MLPSSPAGYCERVDTGAVGLHYTTTLSPIPSQSTHYELQFVLLCHVCSGRIGIKQEISLLAVVCIRDFLLARSHRLAETVTCLKGEADTLHKLMKPDVTRRDCTKGKNSGAAARIVLCRCLTVSHGLCGEAGNDKRHKEPSMPKPTELSFLSNSTICYFEEFTHTHLSARPG